MTKAERIAAYLKDIAGAEGLEAFRVDEAQAAALSERRRSEESAAGLESLRPPVDHTRINGALETVMADRALAPDQAANLEAIIIPDKRPAFPLARGTYSATHQLWRHLDDATTKTRLTTLARSVGRIEVPGSGYPYGGTGFVVGPGLVMTNRHVAAIFAKGLGTSGLLFQPGISPGFSTTFAPENAESLPLVVTKVVMIHPYWDMALLRVEGLGADMVPLKLASTDIVGFRGEEIAVIGYPAFDPRNDSAVQKTVFDNRFGIKQLQPGLLRERSDAESFGKIVNAITHDCSTLGGNSGSAAFHIASGKVLALHFGGEYLARNYAVPASELARDNRVIDAGVSFEPTASPEAAPSWTGFWASADSHEGAAAAVPVATNPQTVSPAMTSSVTRPTTGSDGSVSVVVPLTITIRLGETGSVQASAAASAVETERMVEPVRDADYSNRRGYDPDFLGVNIPLPSAADPAAVAQTRAGGMRLDYQHFSVVMHAKRRLALFTACNVTADPAAKQPESGKSYSRKALGGLGKNDQEKWFLDERLDEKFQLPDVFFTRDDGNFDKGHIVRREDVAWGGSYAEVRRANGDTFHVTNCSPQVKPFNQSQHGKENWGDLENVVLENAASEKLALFAGPVLAANDPRFLGNFGAGQRRPVAIPTRYWKVIVARTTTGLAAFGFVLEQDLSDMETTEFAVPEEFQAYLVAISDIADMTGVKFPPAVLDADQFDGRGPEIAARARVGRRPRRSR